MSPFVKAADALVQSISGSNGRGGNGGLISRETIRKTDELRQMVLLEIAAETMAEAAAAAGEGRDP